MFVLYSKLKNLKCALKAVNRRSFSNISERVQATELELKHIQEELFGRNKAPGPDGFTAEFYKECWDSVGGDITLAVLDFFNTGRLLPEVSSTIIALVPKTQIPASQKDFRPISCCNVVYKIITKIIANRLKKVLPNLISNE